MSCDLDALSLYLDGDLTPDRYRQVSVHIRDCSLCRRELTELRKVDRVLTEWGGVREQRPVSSDLRTRRAVERRGVKRLRALSRASSAAVGTAAAAMLIMLSATLAPAIYQPRSAPAVSTYHATHALRLQSRLMAIARRGQAVLVQPAVAQPLTAPHHARPGVN